MNILEDVAKGNGRALNETDRKKIDGILSSIETTSSQRSEGKLSFWHMFKRKHALKSLVLMLAWITTNVSSYTLQLNATRLAGNVFLNFFLAALAEVSAYLKFYNKLYTHPVHSFQMPASVILFFTLNAGKRKWNTAFFLIMLSICCFILAFIPKACTMLYNATVTHTFMSLLFINRIRAHGYWLCISVENVL